MSSIPCTWEQFKQMAKEFADNAPSMNLEELDNAFKCIGLAYMGMTEKMWQHSAVIVLKMQTRIYMEREYQLTKENEHEHER